jgi:hypothetical protein
MPRHIVRLGQYESEAGGRYYGFLNLEQMSVAGPGSDRWDAAEYYPLSYADAHSFLVNLCKLARAYLATHVDVTEQDLARVEEWL